MVHDHVLRESDVHRAGLRRRLRGVLEGDPGQEPREETDGDRGDGEQHQQQPVVPTVLGGGDVRGGLAHRQLPAGACCMSPAVSAFIGTASGPGSEASKAGGFAGSNEPGIVEQLAPTSG